MYAPEASVHKHLMIAISGFLSEKSDQSEDWEHLKNYCKQYNMPLFAVCWEAQSTSDVGKILVDGVKNLKISKLSVLGGVSGIVKGLASIDNARTVMNAYSDSKSLFSKARDNAKMTGKVLGHFLACNPMFDSYSVSLIGFSLGS